MGGGTSSHDENFTDEEKRRLMKAMENTYEESSKKLQEEGKSGNESDAVILSSIASTFRMEGEKILAEKTTELNEEDSSNKADSVEDAKPIALMSSEDILKDIDDSASSQQINSLLENLKVISSIKSPEKSFRSRRLTYSTDLSHDYEGNILGESMKQRRRTAIFASSEIGVVPKAKFPFPVEYMGTYSCHGIEPSLENEDNIIEKINQDRGCIVHPYHGKEDMALLCVLDGHGRQGDKVSDFVMRQLVFSLDKNPLLTSQPIEALKKVYIDTNEALKSTKFDYVSSGCTCITVLVCERTLYIANVGDSRAVMGSFKEEKWLSEDLSEDHKPDLPEEQARIEKMGGYVCPPQEEGLSARVYLDPEFRRVGLAMSRSIGDYIVKSVGVIAEPDVKIYELQETDRFLVLGSDGIWEFISSQEAIDIVSENLDRGVYEAAETLIQVAQMRWEEEEGDYRDDITAIVIKVPLPFQVNTERSEV